MKRIFTLATSIVCLFAFISVFAQELEAKGSDAGVDPWGKDRTTCLEVGYVVRRYLESSNKAGSPKLAAEKRMSTLLGNRKCSIDFTVGINGGVIKSKVFKSSGVPAIDSKAVDFVLKHASVEMKLEKPLRCVISLPDLDVSTYGEALEESKPQ